MNRTLLTSLILIFLGSYLASQVQRDFGNIQVQDVRFKGDAGNTMSGLLYIPKTATPATPQPGILAVHGYINSRETQSGFAIEFARRGFVVLALDQTGHGYSDAPAFANGFGGPDGLKYLRSRKEVDPERIGLEGHSMGGWSILMAAAAMPDAYAAMVLAGSSTGTLGTPEGTPDFPKNLLLILSRFDEFSEFMWGSAVPANIVSTDKLKTLFDSSNDIKAGQLYGDPEQGTARQLAMPNITHAGDHLSFEAIGHAIDWMQDRLQPELLKDSADQNWHWKELGTLFALIGLVLLIFPLGQQLLKLKLFNAVHASHSNTALLDKKSWQKTALLTALVPMLTYFPMHTIGALIVEPNMIFAQSISNGIVLWMLVNGAISMFAYRRWVRLSNVDSASIWPSTSSSEIGSAFLLALVIVGILYLVAMIVDVLFLTDFRFWVVALKLMSATQWSLFIVYLPFFVAFFISLGLVLHRQLKLEDVSLSKTMLYNCLILSSGFILLLIIQYTPLFLGGSLTIASMSLHSIIAFQFVPLMVIIGVVSTWFYYQTTSLYPGAFVNGLFVTWYVVAGQATQAIPLLA